MEMSAKDCLEKRGDEQEKARELIQENHSKSEAEKTIESKENELKQNPVEKEIQVMKNELKNKIQIESYFSKFESLIDRWMNASLNEKEKGGGTVSLEPLFFHYPFNQYGYGFFDIRDACEMFANVLQTLGIKTSNKFVHKNTGNDKEIKEALNEAENGILFLEYWFFRFCSVDNGVDYFEAILDKAKKKNIFLVVAELSGAFERSKEVISDFESWISNHFQRVDL